MLEVVCRAAGKVDWGRNLKLRTMREVQEGFVSALSELICQITVYGILQMLLLEEWYGTGVVAGLVARRMRT